MRPFQILAAAALVLGIGIGSGADAAPLFGIDSLNNQFVGIDPDTGAITPVGPTNQVNTPALAYNSDNDAFYTVSAATNNLLTIDSTTGNASVVGGLSFVDILGLSYNPGTGLFYAIDGGAGGIDHLLEVDPADASITVVGGLRATGVLGVGGIAFNTDTGVLFGAGQTATNAFNLVSFDLTTGAASIIAPLVTQVTALTFDPTNDMLYGIYRYFDGRDEELIRINPATGETTLIAATPGRRITGLAFGAEVMDVPEPATLALLGTGLAGVVLAARRRRKTWGPGRDE